MTTPFMRRLLFQGYVVSLMHSPDMAILAQACIGATHEQFFEAPASSSGLHHPEFALGSGGLVRHTLAVMHVARDLAQAYDLDQPTDLDIITLASALHDTFKGLNEDDEWGATNPEHAILAAQNVFQRRHYKMPTEFQNQLAHTGWAIRNHMSMWGVPPKPINEMSYRWSEVVANADYIASRKYMLPTPELLMLFAQMEERNHG